MADNSNFSLSATRVMETTQKIFEPGYVPSLQNGVPADLVVKASFIQWLAAHDNEQESLVRTYRDYYDGEHKYQLTDRMKDFLQLDSNIKFDLNYLPIPVDILVERLNVEGFETEEERDSSSDLPDSVETMTQSAVFDTWWQKNRMDALQGDVHHAAARDGDSYLIVGWDDETGTPSFTAETAYDGTNGVIVRYEESARGVIKFAIKRWRIESGPGAGQTSRMNVYAPDAIFKYITGRNGWEPFVELDEMGNELEWPRPWLDRDGRPLGVPVIHFRNNAGGYDFGKSELNDIIPAQDALNKAVIDELAAADTEGFRIITLSGGQEPTSGFTIGPGRALWAPQGNFGHIPAGSLAGVSGIVDKYISRMAQMSRTPLAYFQVTGQVAAAETQRADDTGLVSKAEKRAVDFGNAWEDAMAIGRRLHNALGSGPELAENVLIFTKWHSFERVDKGELDRKTAETDKMRAETFQILVINGVPRELAARMAGYDDDTAVEIGLRAARVLPQDRVIEPPVSDLRDNA